MGVKQLSVWSVTIKRTDKGYQAKVFTGWHDPTNLERPTYYNSKSLHELLERIETEIIPALPDNFISLKKKELNHG